MATRSNHNRQSDIAYYGASHIADAAAEERNNGTVPAHGISGVSIVIAITLIAFVLISSWTTSPLDAFSDNAENADFRVGAYYSPAARPSYNASGHGEAEPKILQDWFNLK